MKNSSISALSDREKRRIEYLVQEYFYNNYRKDRNGPFDIGFLAYLGGTCEKINIDMLDSWVEYAKTTETYKNNRKPRITPS